MVNGLKKQSETVGLGRAGMVMQQWKRRSRLTVHFLLFRVDCCGNYSGGQLTVVGMMEADKTWRVSH